MAADRADFGSRLRAAREARGMSLKDIAAATKISTLVLEALERSDVSRLPGGLFSRAFVRAYAKEVGLDPEQAVREFVEHGGEGGEAAPVDQPLHVRPSRVEQPGGAHAAVGWLGLAITLILVIVWIGVDRYYSRRAEAPPAQARTAAASTAPAAPKPPPLPVAEPLTPPAPAQAETGRPLQPPDPGVPAPSTAVQPASIDGQRPGTPDAPMGVSPLPTVGQGQAPETQPPGQGGAAGALSPAGAKPAASLPLRIVLSSSAPCWLSLKVDDQRLSGRMLEPGEKLELSAAQAVVLTVGNAGVLSYTINEAPGRPLGADGQVVTVVINTANYQTFVARREWQSPETIRRQ